MIPLILCGVVVSATPPADDLRPLLDAIRMTETGGTSDSANAAGDHGRSIGPYQISRKYWIDSGAGGTWETCRNAAVAERTMISYWRRHCPNALRQRSWEVLARVHNGGPNGHRRAATSQYWRAVRHRLEDHQQRMVRSSDHPN